MLDFVVNSAEMNWLEAFTTSVAIVCALFFAIWACRYLQGK
jgi:hypothetical protein